MKSTLITAEELAAMSPDGVLIVDCRFDLADADKGERDYRAEHIPGAMFAHLDRDLSDLGRVKLGLGRHPLPTEEAFSALLSRLGWRPGLQVVSYDANNGSLAAARLWWLLRLCGVREAAVLNGGHAAWKAANLPVSREIPQRQPTQVSVHYESSQVVIDHAAIGSRRDELLIDARATPRYRGEVEPIDRVAGHVPGAANRPFTDNLQADGRFKSPAELREAFRAVIGDHAPEQVVHMCGSGVTACHNLLAMEHAGLTGSRLYAPSWSGWISDTSRPVATGNG
ncbi:sulfurtransferase [Dyella nitratireducens]|uniref:Sulfurtransferase n=1 Tax=Dyella nitratireducens TaxID=1849580 RepID=A0ABQ1FK10_9GAMM|nr:sulfurtransferase [Dyella nitratireducens]GGA18861.1 sulfurtransferase [Dyella nitratireducens]GLQ44597.1 sulfurtransferase [Dyella nitratireducens]